MLIVRLILYYFQIIYWNSLPISVVKRKQLKKFKEVFEYAKKHSAFYRDIYTKANVLDLEIKSIEDIKKIPVIDKATLRKYSYEQILTQPITKDLNPHSTSGSSGVPFMLYFDKYTDYTAHIRVLYTIRKATGYTPFKKIAMITRYGKDEKFGFEQDLSLVQKLQNFFRLFRREIISIHEEPDIIIEQLIASKPDILWSTPSIAEIVVNRLAERNIQLNIPSLVFTSESFSPLQFKKFYKHISENIVDVYGSMESPCLGYEVNHSGVKHVFPNSNMFEYVDSEFGDPKTSGSVVVTNLLNKVMPIIRYNLNDLGQKLDSDEFPYRRIGPIDGRIDDLMDLPDGRSFAHHHAYEMLMDFFECEQYKFIQNHKDFVILQLKIKEEASEEFVRAKAYERWSKNFSPEYLRIEFVDRFVINPKTGKFKNIEKTLRY